MVCNGNGVPSLCLARPLCLSITCPTTQIGDRDQIKGEIWTLEVLFATSKDLLVCNFWPNTSWTCHLSPCSNLHLDQGFPVLATSSNILLEITFTHKCLAVEHHFTHKHRSLELAAISYTFLRDRTLNDFFSWRSVPHNSYQLLCVCNGNYITLICPSE